MTCEEWKSLVFFSVLFICLMQICKIHVYNNRHKRGKYFYIISFLILTYLLGNRVIDISYGGKDTKGYILQFLNTTQNSTFNDSEPLYKIYIHTIRIFTDNWRLFMIISISILVSCFLYFIYSFYEERFVYTLFLIWPIFLYYSCSVLRNGLAIALSQVSIVLLSKRKYVFALLLSTAAVFFHYSAISVIVFEVFLFFVAVLNKLKVKIYNIILISMFILIISIPIITRIFESTRYVFLARNVNSSILGYLPYYMIGILALKNHQLVIEKYGSTVCLYAVYFLCLIYPMCQIFGIYRIPYYFISPLCVIAADIVDIYYEKWIVKTKKSYFVYYFSVFLVFSIYGILKTITISRESGILLYKLII